MGFWNDLSRFAGNMTGGWLGESDEERRRKLQKAAPYVAAPTPKPQARPVQGQRTTQQQNADRVFSQVNSTRRMSPGSQTAVQGGQARAQRGLRVQADNIDEQIDERRRQVLDRSFDEGQSFESISDRTGLGVEEVRRYADKKRPGYGVKPLTPGSVLDGGLQLGKDMIGAAGHGLTKMTGLTTLNTGAQDEALKAAYAARDRGEITEQKLFETASMLGKDVIGKKVIRDKQGRTQVVDQNAADFARDFTQTGYDVVSLAPIGSGAKAGAKLTEKLAPRIVKEGAAWGTADTANDVVQGQWTPEQMAANYALNIGLEGAGAGVGKMSREALEAQRGPNSERGALGPMVDPAQDARERFAKGRDLGDKEAPVREVSPEVLLQRATNAGLNPKTAKAMMEEFGRNKFAIMLETSGDLRGAKNPAGLAKSVLKKIPDGDTVIGGVAKNNDLMPNDPTLDPVIQENVSPQPQAPDAREVAASKLQPSDDPLAALRDSQKKTDSMKADETELSVNLLEQTINDESWGRDKAFIGLHTDNAQRRLNQVIERRLNVLKTAHQDKLQVIQDGDSVQHIDPRTGEIIASYNQTDLAGKTEAFAKTTQYVNGKDPVNTPLATSEAPGQAPTTQPIKVPTSIKEITKATPQRGDLQGHQSHVEGIEAYAMKLADETSAKLEKIGMTFEDMVTMIDNGRRALDNGAKHVDIDSRVLKIYSQLRKDMDKAYRTRQSKQLDGRKDEGFGNIDKLYWPRYGEADMRNTSMLDQIEDASVLSRTGRDMNPDTMDKSPRALSKYMVEMLGDQDNRRIVEKIKEAEVEGRKLTPNQAMEAIDLENALIENIKETAKNGKIRSQSIVQQLADIGAAKGKQVTVVEKGIKRSVTEEAFRQFETLKIDQHKTLDDLMSKPYRARAYAIDTIQAEADIIEDFREVFPDLAPQHLTGFSKKWDNAMARYTDADGDITEYKIAVAERLYKRAAVQDILDYCETHRFTDKYTNDLINYQLGPLLVQGRIDQNFGQKLSRMYTSMTDRALRGWNVKSATVELTEMQKLPTVFGTREFLPAAAEMRSPDAIAGMIDRYGKKHAVGAAREFFEANPTLLEKIGDAVGNNKPALLAKAIADPRAMIRGVELYRSAVSLRTIERFHQKRGLEGHELTDAVWDDFRRVSLPSDQETHIALQRHPASRAIFQYWQWNVRNTKEDYRLAFGKEDAGKLSQGMSSRARFIGMSLANKSALWMVYAGTGTSAAYAFNLFDPFGVLEEQWTGINEEEMSLTDKAVKYTGFSPLTSLTSSAYFSWRQEQERVESINEGDEWKVQDKTAAYKQDNVVNNFQAKTPLFNLAPGTGQYKKTKGAYDLDQKEFYDGTDGRVRYQAPKDGSFDEAMSYVFGRGATKAGKEYNDTADPLFKGFLNGGVDGFIREARKDAVIGKIFGSTKERQRPLATSSYDKGFNERAKEAFNAAVDKHGMQSQEARDVMKGWIDLGRTYNKVLDDFRKKNPAGYNRWQATFDENIVSPEKWKIYTGNPEVFEFAKARKKLEQEHLGRVIDPIYNLPDERAKQMLQHRSLHTGDDMKNAQMLYKTDWYEQFQKDMDAYGKQFEGQGDPKKTARAKEWDTLSKSLYSTKDAPEFNLVKQLQDISDQHGFGSQVGKDFLKANYDAWKVQKDAYDRKRFDTVNRMRQIEGVAALTWEQFTAKIEFESDSSTATSSGSGSGYYDKDGTWKSYKKGGSGGGSGGSSDNAPNTGVASTISSFGNQGAGMTDVKAKGVAGLKNPTKVVKTSKRANRQSPIRIKL